MRRPASALQDRVTRAIDLAASVGGLIFFAPVFILIALLVKLSDGGPVFFAQTRVGQGGRPFKCLKFRTMAVDAEEQLRKLLARDPVARAEWERDHKLREDPRITAIGRFLRKSSLDELPQLINIIKGEMALVGPRPIVEAEIVRYGRHFKRYCEARPGLTGLWQVGGRNAVTYRERVVMDVAYVRYRCIRLDLKIIWKTIPAVFLRHGAY
ncbi:sugar transferase [Phenylobacterium sp.]|uniref:sugar transferase n=1 Tax=Phenylobacterium sp. TaxID=1871053 RepID=UPI0035B1E3FA